MHRECIKLSYAIKREEYKQKLRQEETEQKKKKEKEKEKKLKDLIICLIPLLSYDVSHKILMEFL